MKVLRIRFVRNIAILGGCLILAGGLWSAGERGEGWLWSNIVFNFVQELGVALIIAAVVAVGVERFVTVERIIKILGILGPWKEAEDVGFRRLLASRQDAFEDLIHSRIPEAQHTIEIMGICVSLFREVRKEAENTRDRNLVATFKEQIVGRLEKGCNVTVLSLCRYPTDQQRAEYGIGDRDIYYWREHDEERTNDPNFQEGRRLKGIANKTLGRWIEVLVSVAERVQSAQERTRLLGNLQVMEYLALPSISVYRVDDLLYFTPYLFKRHCRNVPTYAIQGEDTPLFQDYANHFKNTFEDPLTTSAIPDELRTRLVENPLSTIREYRDAKDDLKDKLDRGIEDTWTRQDLAKFRVEELAVCKILGCQMALDLG